MDDTVELFIDLNAAGLDPESLDNYTRRLVGELKDDRVAEDASLISASNMPEGSKAGGAGFDLGFLKAEVNLKNIGLLLNWLKTRMVGATLEIEYGDVKLKYRTPEELEQQLAALETISHLTVRVVKPESK